ncbi:phenol 2-monooxygenase-like protein [Lindgomyces ingoldianus]|uniref:Phenol 2-monooxygenase-like protein n=1 Tax=Lindgomyces ingoldianus TaxID=673940 RepID=A0ACB6QQS8_9PLEO|nr:phenol 2-monooxygenase-like protein [Lindgomyces ingoldianus]KAF2468923.1 phenol 2-monooxygenase-like protein [Lindgomyces ingoldianus]
MTRKANVLICGSGSAGISAGVWLSRYGIPCTILERRRGPMQIGQADGVQCRTVEIYESFGIAEELLRESYHVLEVAFWAPDGNGGIFRQSRTADTMPGLSHMPHVILNQARMNGLMLGAMDRFSDGEQGIEYGVEVKSVQVDESKVGDPEAHCVKVVAEKNGRQEVFEAKYVLGCDGAHSIVRKSLGYNMIGDTTDTVWGVMDVFPRTNFPDIRRKSTLHSPSGNLLIIPREGGSMVRFYIQLPPGSIPKDIKLEDLQSTARKIFHPYTMDIAETFWWSAYSIGQRLADNFHKNYRVFLTGDACHTHSPKAGQGMNVSLQDGYNIGWKLGMILSGQAPHSLLHTYVLERAKVAKDLIDFDREFARMFSAKEGSPEEFRRYFIKAGRYTAGLTARYEDSEVTDLKGSRQEVARGIVVGMRFPSAQVVRFCDCKAMQLMRGLTSDGRWRILVFAGDITVERDRKRLEELADFLARMTWGYTLPTADIDSLIEPVLVLRTKFAETEQERIHGYFWPVTGKWRMRDLHKVYIDDEHYNSGHGHAYEKYEVDPAVGAVVIVRPDQYVAKVTTMDDFEGITGFFKGFMIKREGRNEISGKL